jgi:hypothetical protein
MSDLTLHEDGPGAIEVRASGALLFRYVVVPGTAGKESPRPYVHPLRSLAGDTLTNFRPNDHPWHHALSFTLNQVSGVNFWGGPTCARGEGYAWRDDHGEQRHEAWTARVVEGSTAQLSHRLTWSRGSRVLFREERTLEAAVDRAAGSWSLRWSSRLRNVSGEVLSLGNPHSHGGLAGSHYSGLQFRGARELLDDHLDPTIKVAAEGGLEGVAAVHGALARWMEWHGQMDGSLHRVVIRFENLSGPLPWFVRRNYPLAAFPTEFDHNREIGPDGLLEIDHRLTFTSTP